MLASGVAEARELGFREMGLGSRDAIGAHLFEAAGFRRLVDVRWWRAPRMEGGESARIPDPAEARKLWPWVAASAGIDLYHGVSPDFNGARDLGPDELARLAGLGMLRVGLAGRALVGLGEPWRHNIAGAAGAGGARGRVRLLPQARSMAWNARGVHSASRTYEPHLPRQQ